MHKALKTIFTIVGILAIAAAILISWLSYKTSDQYIQKTTSEAVATNDPSLCEKLIAGIMNDNPIPDCYNQVAIQNKNLAICSQKSWCYRAYFKHFRMNDQNLCKVIENQEDRNRCYFEQNLVLHDIELCFLIQLDTLRSSCYINVASFYKDTTICDTYLLTQHEKKVCYESFGANK